MILQYTLYRYVNLVVLDQIEKVHTVVYVSTLQIKRQTIHDFFPCLPSENNVHSVDIFTLESNVSLYINIFSSRPGKQNP